MPNCPSPITTPLNLANVKNILPKSFKLLYSYRFSGNMLLRLFIFCFMIIELFWSSTVLARRGERKRKIQVIEVSQPLVSAYSEL